LFLTGITGTLTVCALGGGPTCGVLAILDIFGGETDICESAGLDAEVVIVGVDPGLVRLAPGSGRGLF